MYIKPVAGAGGNVGPCRCHGFQTLSARRGGYIYGELEVVGEFCAAAISGTGTDNACLSGASLFDLQRVE